MRFLSNLKDFLTLIRYKNLFIIIFMQLTAYYSLIIRGHTEYFNDKLIYLIAATVLIAAAAYIFNDYLDVKADMINKPEKLIISKSVSPTVALIVFIILNIIALVLGAFTQNLFVWFTFSLTILALFIYNMYLKKIPLAGNITIAALMSLSLIILWFFQPGVDKVNFIFYSLFAFLSGLFREILKDAEDIEGDRQAGYVTFPVRFGIGLTEFLLFFILLIFVILLIIFSWSMLIENRWWISLYLFIAVIIPCFYMFPKVFKCELKQDVVKLTRTTKLIMISGTLSMFLLII